MDEKAHEKLSAEPLSAYGALARLCDEAPALPDTLAAAAEVDAAQRRDIVNSLNLGDQTVLQSLEIVRLDPTAGRLDVTDFGHEVIDAAGIVAADNLSPEQHERRDEEAERKFQQLAARDQSMVSND